MLTTMQAGTDSFEFHRQALLKSKVPLDFTYETAVTGFNVSGTEPVGCNRRVIFLVDDQLYKFGSNGLDLYEERGELADILEGGNTVAELLAVTDIPDWAGKKVYPIVALDAPADTPVMPRLKISAKVNSFNDVYAKTEYSPVYKLKCTGDAAKIYDIRADISTNGHATVIVQCKLFDPVSQAWGDWIYLAEAANKFTTQIQYKISYTLTTLDGSDYAKVENIRCYYTTDADKLSGSSQEIITLAQDYPADLKTCYALIKHDKLIDADIKAYVNFSAAPARRENSMIGTTTGEEQTLYLTFNGIVDRNILQSTIHLEVGGKTFSGFYFDTENSTVTLKAEAGQDIFASYDCGFDDENWLEMAKDFTQADGNCYASRFTYRLTDSTNKKVAAVKFVLTRLSGTAENTQIGTGNGKLQNFALEHNAIAESLVVSGAWRYDETAQILKTVVPIDNPVELHYQWQGQIPHAYSYITGFAV